MTTSKMKGLLKGLRYISQIFDEEKEQEMQIGNPTDVKHVAHIGWDGPTVDSPSWMKEFKASTGFQSAPLGPTHDSRENPEIKWVSEDSKRGHSRATTGSPKKDLPELPKSSRRHSDNNNTTSNDSPRKQKSRQSRRQQAKDSSDKSTGQESTSSGPSIPRKSHRKKTKDSNDGGGSTRSKSKGTTPNDTETVFSDPGQGPDADTMLLIPRSRFNPVPSLGDEENEIRVTLKD